MDPRPSVHTTLPRRSITGALTGKVGEDDQELLKVVSNDTPETDRNFIEPDAISDPAERRMPYPLNFRAL